MFKKKKKDKTEYPGGVQYKNARKYQYQTKNEHSPSYMLQRSLIRVKILSRF